MDAPIADGGCVVATDDEISAIEYAKALDTEGATTRIDAHGATLAPV